MAVLSLCIFGLCWSLMTVIGQGRGSSSSSKSYSSSSSSSSSSSYSRSSSSSQAGWTKSKQSKTNKEATASFTEYGIYGTVSVSDGALVTVSLDITDLDTSLIGGDSCFDDGGFMYHIHEKWDHSSNDNRLGSTDCGSTFTGGHWDPWLGCGGATGNEDCDSKGGCVTGSSVLGDDGYSCNSDDFAANPYVCEVGDWSGKYGKIEVDMDYHSRTMYASNSDAFEVDAMDLEGRSVVFHCTDGSRVFCAPFTIAHSGKSDSSSSSKSDSDDGDDRPSQSESGKIAIFDSLGDRHDNYIKMESDGSYDIRFMTDDFSLPSDCDYLEYRVYNDWSKDNVLSAIGCDECKSVVGEFFDPTVSCAPYSDSEFCECDRRGGGRCGDSSQVYMCDFEDERFSCAPGDLSGKYGAIDTSKCDDGAIEFETSGVDDLMIDLRQLDGKSVVLQCRDSYRVVACAQFL